MVWGGHSVLGVSPISILSVRGCRSVLGVSPISILSVRGCRSVLGVAPLASKGRPYRALWVGSASVT